MAQRLTNGKYMFEAKINHNKIFSIENKDAKIFTDVGVFVSLETPVVMGKIRNLHVESE